VRVALDRIREHPRHLLLGAFVAGLLVAPLGLAAVASAAAGAAFGGGRTPLALVAAAALIAGVLVAGVRLHALDAGVLHGASGRTIVARVTLLEPVREREAGPAVARVRLLDGFGRGEQAVLRVRRWAYTTRGDAWPEVGDILSVRGRVHPLGLADAYQARRNAHAAITATRVTATGTRRGGIAGTLDGIRRRAEAGLDAALDPSEAALLRGMVLGEDERLEETVREDFQRSGLAHILT